MSHLSVGGRQTSARLVKLLAGIVTFQGLMLLAFAWPATESGPRDVPIAVAGPEQAVAPLEQALTAVPGTDDGTPAFEVTMVPDEAAATEAILDRDVYGALIASPEGNQLLVASGAGPAVARLLQNAAATAISDDAQLNVRDVVPPTEDDPTGSGLATAVLPLVLTSGAGGLIAGIALKRTGHRLAFVAGLAVVAGFVASALIQAVLGITDGSYWTLAGTIALLVGAISATVGGLGAAFGIAGAGAGMASMILVGNPLSAAISAPEMLPQPWGAVGQLMPPGAGVTAVRSAGFFDGAAAGTPLTVLGVWLAAGLALVLAAALRGSEAGTDETIVADHGEPAARPS